MRIMTRLTPNLDSTVSSKEVKAGETTIDKLVVAKTNEKDVWPTYPETNVTEGETAKSTRVCGTTSQTTSALTRPTAATAAAVRAADLIGGPD